MARYAMVTDLRKCVGCEACTAACNAEWSVPEGQARTHVKRTPTKGTFPDLSSSVFVAQCNHCDSPPCVDVCPSGATFAAPDGVVRVDSGLCIGCGFCVGACPYDARFLDARTKKVNKCDFCSPRIARGESPACVATCTAHAKHFGDLEDPKSDVHRMVFLEGARRMESKDVAIGPNVFYLGKPEQLDLVAASFAPRAPRMPLAGDAWAKLAKPLVIAAVGATFAGQAVAFFNQLNKGEEDFED
jgi:tetrathionate reductase subunit B